MSIYYIYADIFLVNLEYKYMLYLLMIPIFSTKKYFKNVENNVNSEWNKIFHCLCRNKLVINVSKTNFMVFNKANKPLIPNIYIDNHQIEITDFVRFIRILLVSRVTKKKHI